MTCRTRAASFASTATTSPTTRPRARCFCTSIRCALQQPLLLRTQLYALQAAVDGTAAFERVIRWNDFQHDDVGTQASMQPLYAGFGEGEIGYVLTDCYACRAAPAAAQAPTPLPSAAI